MFNQDPAQFALLCAVLLVGGFAAGRWSARERLAVAQERLQHVKDLLSASQNAVAIRPRAPPVIEINSISNGQAVEHKTTVRGTVSPEWHKVQVLIFSGDKKWWPQKTTVTNGSWQAECSFGATDTPSRSEFTVIAIDGFTPLPAEVRVLPAEGARSAAVTVYRA